MEHRHQSRDARSVVALVATRGRPEYLKARAIPSILAQSRLPDRLIIVVDQDRNDLADTELARLTTEIRAQCGRAFPVTVLRNRRTSPRAAGAWNTGIDQLQRNAKIAAERDLWFVAILDDDDEWLPDHLRLCLEEAVTGDRNMVAAGLIRNDSAEGGGHAHTIPESLDARELFIRGQHIQGSNLFVRLDMLLLAGGFDEHLPSCTDRDLCIRLSRLERLRFGHVPVHTVRHFADPRPDRLSTPASPQKMEGLTRFWNKHADCFDADARAESKERARRLFGWTPQVATAVARDAPALAPLSTPIAMVTGFVTDARVPAHVRGLLDDLHGLAVRPDVAWLQVVVVENGPLPPENEQTLRDMVRAYQGRGLEIELVTVERQREDWIKGLLVDTPDPTRQRLPIAASRTVLNTYVVRAASRQPGAMAWILDDDKRLEIRVARGDGTTVVRKSPDLTALCALRDAGADVVIGPDTDAAPLPFVATLRMQLLDLAQVLGVAAVSAPADVWADRCRRAGPQTVMPDSYYDLARSTEHLETPSCDLAMPPGSTVADMLGFVASKVDRLLAGESVFRPLAVDASTLDPSAAVESVQRGGSAIFFNPQHLLAYPQTIARIGDTYVRRSDMLVSQLLRDQGEIRFVMHAAAGVRHDRTTTERASLNDQTLQQDVLGYALYRTANELMQSRPDRLKRAPLIAWTPAELESAVRKLRKYMTERLAAFTLGAFRILGLAEATRAQVSALLHGSGQWSGSAAARENLECIGREMDRICSEFKPSAVAKFAKRVSTSVTDADVRNAFASMDGLISEYHATQLVPDDASPAMTATRERRARALLEREYEVKAPRLLGMGGEGVVFADEQQVYKVFDLLKRRPNHDTFETLRALAARLERPRHLYPLTRVDVRNETLLLTYPYEASEPYTGGHGAALIDLLRECKRYGIVFRNMHPKNLRVSVSGLKLVDYGSDIRPYTEEGFRSMAERAWLTWRWPNRADLDDVMRRALVDKSMPELDGLTRFWTALQDENASATRMVAEIVDPLVLASSARTALDYGCGRKARSACALAEAGVRVVGFDPGEGVREQWPAQGARPQGLALTDVREVAVEGGPFDAVVCSLVLCELESADAYEQALSDLRRAVVDTGRVIVTVCNPFSTFGGPTALHRCRDLPEGVTYDDSFGYSERAESDSPRREFHRPLHLLERDLLRHGLRVDTRIESQAVDLQRFEPASDFLTLVCSPVVIDHPGRRVSLVIKTCAMESATIERLVDHLVRQLEGPRTFHERILAIDARPNDFTRQYTTADLEGVVAAAARLVRRGAIDRFLIGPSAGEASRRINREWFSVDSPCSHTGKGAPLATPLFAFEACTGDYILQVDSDLLVGRSDRGHDYLGEMIAAIEASPDAVTASLNPPRKAELPFSAGRGGQPWRTEVRGCLLHRARLLAARPFPNELEGGVPALSWHRSLDRVTGSGSVSSLRGGGTESYFIHPPNEFKQRVPDWMLLLDLVDEGCVAEGQSERVDLAGDALQWVPRNRSEPVVVVITGRNVAPSRVRRCLQSLAAQRWAAWGAIVVDDASSTWSRDYLRHALDPWADRVTLIQPRERRGQLANMVLAIRTICTNPESVIVTLDLDDALIGAGVLDRVMSEYLNGADVTVGSMLRTDKHVEYPVSFDDPRGSRGGNVWQHLRSFRKRLFDAIPDHELRVDGSYPEIAVDWAFMIPIVEAAEKPVWIREPLYLYEPSGMGKGADREERERQIGAVMRTQRRRSSQRTIESSPIRPESLTPEIWGATGGILFLRHGERPSFSGMSPEARHLVRLTEQGRLVAYAAGSALGEGVCVVSSPVIRAIDTAEAIAEAAGLTCASIRRIDALATFRIAALHTYEAVKHRLGWSGLMAAWTDGSLPPDILVPCEMAATGAIDAALLEPSTSRVVAVTHDFMIIALLAALRGVRVRAVPYLGAVFVSNEEAKAFAGRSFAP